MLFAEKEIRTKDGQVAIIRNARTEDAAALLRYLKTTASETPYLMREPEEITLTLEQEENFIKHQMESEKDLMLVALLNGRHIGNCSMSSLGAYQRYSHRCSVAIALYKEFCGLGLGRQMMQAILEEARNCGYEQAELEVVSENQNAIALYESLGFEKYGTHRNNMKYKNGCYADAYLMVKYF